MEDKELFELWENKIKIEISNDIVSQKVSLWSILHNIGHRAVSWFMTKNDNISEKERILEVGCGTCHFTNFIEKPLMRNYVGLDISRRMLNLNPTIEVKRVQGDIYKLPFADGVFDHIISIYNFEHLHRLDEALNEIIRVLASDGVLIFSIPMEGGLLYGMGRNITSKRLIEKKYKIDYLKIIKEYEHPNVASYIIKVINDKFLVVDKLFLPFFIPSVNVNVLAVYKVKRK